MTNEQVIEQGIKKMMGLIDNQMQTALSKTMNELVDLTLVPVKTHNLWDSIGVGIYNNGTMEGFKFPPVIAQKPQKFKGKSYWGHEELSDMVISNYPSSIQNHRGWALYYVAAQPYSQIVDDRTDGNVLHEDKVVQTFLSNIIKL